MSDGAFLESEAPVETAMDELMQYVEQLKEARERVAFCADELAAAEKHERKLSEEVLPILLDSHGVSSITLSNGMFLEVKEDVKASVPKDVVKRQKALAWLSANGAGVLIKDEVTIEDPTLALLATLDLNSTPYVREQNVNSSSLAAWFREKFGIKKGTVCSMDMDDVSPDLSVYRYRKTTLK
jgi:hypothetical protein